MARKKSLYIKERKQLGLQAGLGVASSRFPTPIPSHPTLSQAAELLEGMGGCSKGECREGAGPDRAALEAQELREKSLHFILEEVCDMI